MGEWNVWTEKSVKLLEEGYLDKLLEIYKGESGNPREVPEEIKKKLREAYDYAKAQGTSEADKKLVGALLNARKETERSPFNHPYLPLIYHLVSEEEKSGSTFEEALEKVASKYPETIRILAEEAQRRDIKTLLQRLEEPPEINRQIGKMFKSWYESNLKSKIEQRFQGYTPTPKIVITPLKKQKKSKKSPGQPPLFSEEAPAEADIIIYTGSDKALEELAKRKLGLNEKEKLGTKGIDFYVLIVRNPEEIWHLTGEAKFQSDVGGNQDNQQIVAEGSVRLDLKRRHVGIMLIDGMPVVRRFDNWEEEEEEEEELELSKEKIIASALLLPDLIAEIYRKGEEALGLGDG